VWKAPDTRDTVLDRETRRAVTQQTGVSKRYAGGKCKGAAITADFVRDVPRRPTLVCFPRAFGVNAAPGRDSRRSRGQIRRANPKRIADKSLLNHGLHRPAPSTAG
jgi:hypothetical protein